MSKNHHKKSFKKRHGNLLKAFIAAHNSCLSSASMSGSTLHLAGKCSFKLNALFSGDYTTPACTDSHSRLSQHRQLLTLHKLTSAQLKRYAF